MRIVSANLNVKLFAYVMLFGKIKLQYFLQMSKAFHLQDLITLFWTELFWLLAQLGTVTSLL